MSSASPAAGRTGSSGAGPRVGVHVQPRRAGLPRLVPGLHVRGEVGAERGAVRAEPGYLQATARAVRRPPGSAAPP